MSNYLCLKYRYLLLIYQLIDSIQNIVKYFHFSFFLNINNSDRNSNLDLGRRKIDTLYLNVTEKNNASLISLPPFFFLRNFEAFTDGGRGGEGGKILHQVIRRETVRCFWKSAPCMRGHVCTVAGPLFVGNRRPPNNGDTVVDSVISLSFNREIVPYSSPVPGISAIFNDRPTPRTIRAEVY